MDHTFSSRGDRNDGLRRGSNKGFAQERLMRHAAHPRYAKTHRGKHIHHARRQHACLPAVRCQSGHARRITFAVVNNADAAAWPPVDMQTGRRPTLKERLDQRLRPLLRHKQRMHAPLGAGGDRLLGLAVAAWPEHDLQHAHRHRRRLVWNLQHRRRHRNPFVRRPDHDQACGQALGIFEQPLQLFGYFAGADRRLGD